MESLTGDKSFITLETLINTVDGIVWALDLPDPRYTFVSQQAERILGYPVETWLSDPDFWPKHIHPDDRQWVTAFSRQMTEEMHSYECEYRMLAADGSIVWLHDKVAVIVEDDRPVQLRGVIVDITARRRIEEELQISHQHLVALNEIVQIALSSQDLQATLLALANRFKSLFNARECYITLWDESAHRVLPGVASDNAEGRLFQQRFASENASLTEAVLQSQKPLAVENVRRPIDSQPGLPQPSHCSLLALPLAAADIKLGAVILFFEHTAAFSGQYINFAAQAAAQAFLALNRLRLLEETRSQFDALQRIQDRMVQSEKLAAIGELVAGVAHELNNPLTSVILYSQMLQSRIVDPNLTQDLDKIVNEARRAGVIVRGLLEFARKKPAERKTVQINNVLHNCIDLLNYELRTHNIKVTLILQPDLPLTMADEHQMQQVFINILTNAWQALHSTSKNSPTYGHMQISTLSAPPIFNLPVPGAPRVIRIVFQDDGPGISAENLKHIFDPFFTTKPASVGTGLGLSICHGIISEHGGHIWAESELGRGASFFIELPIVASPSTKDVYGLQEFEPPTDNTQRILVIDDEPVILKVVKDVLSEQGYDVDVVEDGWAGLDLLKQISFDLILCDLHMPGLSGVEFLGRVEEKHPEMLKHIIFTTGDSSGSDTRRIIEEKGFTCLSKPFELKDLLNQIHVAMGASARSGNR